MKDQEAIMRKMKFNLKRHFATGQRVYESRAELLSWVLEQTTEEYDQAWDEAAAEYKKETEG